MSTHDAQLDRWSRSEENPPIAATLVEMFARRVALQPNAPAIEFEGRTWTFAELSSAADRATFGLQRRGIAHGHMVGVYCRRTPELVAVILGLWRCGAVYVPLDPKYPSQRIQAILQQVATRLIVCDAPLPPQIDATGLSTCRADELCVTHVETNEAAPPLSSTLADRAVVLYTSGSTGTPKGAVLSHGNLANHHAYVIREFRLGLGDRRPAVCSISFDASLEEFFCTLLAGATLVLPPTDVLDSLDRFLRFLERKQITALFMPTSLWRETNNFLHAARREYPACVRLIDIGGERVTRPMYDRFLQVGGRRMRWINVYGPTECSIYATTYEHDPARDSTTTDAPPIGRPIDNVRLFVVDATGRLCAPGEEGELYIGGAGVGEGYLNRADMTAERYVAAPAAEMPPGRYYRTGDQVRFRTDGELEYVGRLDDQVKLRGLRIEPGEIEATLQQHPTIRDAVVAVRTSRLNTPYLAGYAVLHEGASWDSRALLEFCAARLPEYMVPRVFVQLEKLPQSPNGKVDRRALPDPYFEEPSADCAKETTREPTDLEQRLLDVWRDVLESSDLGLHDDFFVLGGDSLRAMTLTAKLEEAICRPVPAAMLMTAPTVARLAAELERAADEADAPILLRDGDRRQPLFLIHSLGGDVWIYRELVQHLRTDAAVYGLQLPGLEREAAADFDVEELADEYVNQMRTVQPDGPYSVAGYSSGGMVAYEIARRLTEHGEQVALLGLIDAGVPPTAERRLTASFGQRCSALARNLPLLAAELRSQSFGEVRRRIATAFRSRLRKFLGRFSAADDASSSSDGEMLSYFAEDISSFSARRLRQIKEHFAAVFRYEPQPWCGAAHLFRVARQPLSAVPTPTLGWEHLIDGSVAVRAMPGTHDTLMKTPLVERLAAAVDAAMAETQTPHAALATPVAAE